MAEQQERMSSSSPPPHDGIMSSGRFLATRLSSLKPPMLAAPNPWRLLRSLNRTQWAFFLIAFSAWTWDSFDFFTVALTVSDLAETFGRTKADITWGITVVLMLRSVGAIIFGLAGDRYGRKWPFLISNLLFIVFELGTAFCTTYTQFLACRALFGIAMGGLYGNAAATALEDLPSEARGLMSGILQQGYAFGYLLAAAFARVLVNTTPYSWRPLFWFGACPPVVIILLRLALPETQAYRTTPPSSASFVHDAKSVLRNHWLLFVYLVLLMSGFNLVSHGSQDLYPLLLASDFAFTPSQVTTTQVVANLGAMLGGTTVGFLSQSLGRRLCILAMCVCGGALLYPYTFVSSPKGVVAAAFFEQFCVQGAWGVVPVHLMELSPGQFRTFVVGTSYQLGNLVAAASSTIESTLGERFPLPPSEDGESRYQYGKVMCIFMGCAYVYVVVLTLVGPECLQRSFEQPGGAGGQEGEEAEVWEATSARTNNKDVEGVTVVGAER
ncbi:sugar transporter family protein [Schizothecium vesticola]|uniref:Sugar transporter family protein n=1 Tax=Schizothecium vesticola TaxID=314040 RepID=A0AA40K652_9PEZI|nr:sugar transporter family protein [Schizothecium vesticola]